MSERYLELISKQGLFRIIEMLTLPTPPLKLVNPGLGFQSFYTARRTLIGYETMNIIRKGQVYRVAKRNILGQVKFVALIFQLAA